MPSVLRWHQPWRLRPRRWANASARRTAPSTLSISSSRSTPRGPIIGLRESRLETNRLVGLAFHSGRRASASFAHFISSPAQSASASIRENGARLLFPALGLHGALGLSLFEHRAEEAVGAVKVRSRAENRSRKKGRTPGSTRARRPADGGFLARPLGVTTTGQPSLSRTAKTGFAQAGHLNSSLWRTRFPAFE